MAKEPKLAMMPWWAADFKASTGHMLGPERLAFRELLDYQWINGSLPTDPKRLALILGLSESEFQAVWPAFKEHYVRDPNNPKSMFNKRLERERAISIELRTKASAKAKRAAEERWKNASGNASSMMPEALLEQCPPAPALASSESPVSSESPAEAYTDFAGEPSLTRKTPPQFRLTGSRRGMAMDAGLDPEAALKEFVQEIQAGRLTHRSFKLFCKTKKMAKARAMDKPAQPGTHLNGSGQDIPK